jgi:hypothetical protein
VISATAPCLKTRTVTALPGATVDIALPVRSSFYVAVTHTQHDITRPDARALRGAAIEHPTHKRPFSALKTGRRGDLGRYGTYPYAERDVVLRGMRLRVIAELPQNNL